MRARGGKDSHESLIQIQGCCNENVQLWEQLLCRAC